MLAYGKLDRNLMAKGFFQGCLGFEFSGTQAADSARRVMGVARRALATRVCTTENLVSNPLSGHSHPGTCISSPKQLQYC